MRTEQNSQSGFTLVEIMVVCAIVTVLIGMALQSFLQMQRATAQIQAVAQANLHMRSAFFQIRNALADTSSGHVLVDRYIGAGSRRIRVQGGVCNSIRNYFQSVGDSVIRYPALRINSCTNAYNATSGQWEAACAHFNVTDAANSVDDAWDENNDGTVDGNDETWVGLDYQPALLAPYTQNLLVRCRAGQAPQVLAYNVKSGIFNNSVDDTHLLSNQVRATFRVEVDPGMLSRPYNLTESKVVDIDN
jgi:prepilin-type N-terminal cleavage/methylation domain-containing protein